MANKFVPLYGDQNKEEIVISSSSCLLKTGDFISIATEAFRNKCFETVQNNFVSQSKGSVSFRSNKEWSSWIEEGIDCKILGATTKGWKKGKVRIRVILEFCPEGSEEDWDNEGANTAQPKLPLDDIRKTITE